MRRTQAFALLCLALCCLNPFWSRRASGQVLLYSETTGKRTTHFTWELVTEDGARVNVRRDNGEFTNWCETTGETNRWRYRAPGTDVVARRFGNVICIEGITGGRPVRRRFEVDEAPWYQPLSHSLRGFLESDRRSTVFWMIRLDTFRPIKMKAVKNGTEWLALPLGKTEAQRVRLSMNGMLSFFWQSDYWYRIDDGLFLKYAGVNGPPGTPTTTIVLEREQAVAMPEFRPPTR
jgi:hypothetical protein